MIEPMDDDERDRLVRELLVERFGPRPRRRGDDPPQEIARRRRVLCDEKRREAV